MKFLFVLVLATLLKHTGANCVVGTEGQPDCKTCAGACLELDGCYCGTNASVVCLPNQCDITNTSYCCPSGLFWNASSSCCSVTLICNTPCYKDETCKDNNNIASCECNEEYYKYNTTDDLTTTLTCDNGVMIASVSKCLLSSLGYDVNSFQLRNQSDVNCTFIYADIITDQRVQSIQALPKAGWCGNRVRIADNKVYYTNFLYIDILNKNLITVNPVELSFTCSYNLTMKTSLNAALKPVLSTINLNAPNGSGTFSIGMTAYRNKEYNIPFEENAEVPVGSYIYLGILSLDSDSDQFALRVVNCYAAPTKDSSSTDPNSVKLLSGGCPVVDGDVQTVVEANGNGLEARLKISAFQFQISSQVFIFCDVRLCDIKSENCTGCKSGRSDEPSTSQLVIPIYLSEDIYYSSTGSQSVVSSATLVGFLLMLLINKLF